MIFPLIAGDAVPPLRWAVSRNVSPVTPVPSVDAVVEISGCALPVPSQCETTRLLPAVPFVAEALNSVRPPSVYTM